VFAVSRFMGSSIAMIDYHYGHLARDSREHAVSLLDALAIERAVDAGWTPEARLKPAHQQGSEATPNATPEVGGTNRDLNRKLLRRACPVLTHSTTTLIPSNAIRTRFGAVDQADSLKPCLVGCSSSPPPPSPRPLCARLFVRTRVRMQRCSWSRQPPTSPGSTG
jgi:hypothetical protein